MILRCFVEFYSPYHPLRYPMKQIIFMKSTVCFFTALFLLLQHTALAQQQFTVSGVVRDGENESPHRWFYLALPSQGRNNNQ